MDADFRVNGAGDRPAGMAPDESPSFSVNFSRGVARIGFRMVVALVMGCLRYGKRSSTQPVMRSPLYISLIL